MKRINRPGAILCAVACAALVIGACGSTSTAKTATDGAKVSTPTTERVGASLTSPPSHPLGTAVEAPTTTAALSSPLPSIEVLDVATGKRVQLATFLPSNRPVLVWFWAPH